MLIFIFCFREGASGWLAWALCRINRLCVSVLFCFCVRGRSEGSYLNRQVSLAGRQRGDSDSCEFPLMRCSEWRRPGTCRPLESFRCETSLQVIFLWLDEVSSSFFNPCLKKRKSQQHLVRASVHTALELEKEGASALKKSSCVHIQPLCARHFLRFWKKSCHVFPSLKNHKPSEPCFHPIRWRKCSCWCLPCGCSTKFATNRFFFLLFFPLVSTDFFPHASILSLSFIVLPPLLSCFLSPCLSSFLFLAFLSSFLLNYLCFSYFHLLSLLFSPRFLSFPYSSSFPIPPFLFSSYLHSALATDLSLVTPISSH